MIKDLHYFKLYGWRNINRRTVNGTTPLWNDVNHQRYLNKGILNKLSRAEFEAFCDQNEGVILALWQEGETPTVDRIDSNGHYELENIRILSKRHNSFLAQERKQKAVIMTYPDGTEKLFPSMMEASRQTGVRQGNITHLCDGRAKCVNGFKARLALP